MLTFDGGQGLKISWKKTLGSGYSSVSVAGDRAVTMFSDSTFDYIIAFDVNNGSELWRYKMDSTYVGHDGSHNGPISTPVIDGDMVFALGAKGVLYAVGFNSGKLLWSTNLVTDHKAIAPFYGFTTAPFVHGDALIVQTSGSENNLVSGLAKNDGKVLWTSARDTSAYQSPLVLNVAGQQQLVAISNKKVFGLDPTTGKQLWEYEHKGEENASTPLLVDNDKLFFLAKWQESQMLQVQKTGDTFTVTELWKNGNIKQTYNPTVFHEGHLYGYNSRFLTCVNAATGETVWRSRQPGDGFAILVDGHLVIQTKDGRMHVVKASPAGYKEVASLNIFEKPVWTPPSFANGKIFVRGLDEIASVEVGKVADVMAADVPTPATPTVPTNSKFMAFVKKVEAASDKKALIDEFMAAQKQFPIIEGEDFAHFVYRGEVKDLAINGDMFNIGQEVAFNRVAGTDLYYYSIKTTPDANLGYQIKRNFDETITDPLNPHKARSFNGEQSVLAMPKRKVETHFEDPAEGMVRGRIDSVNFESKILENSRKLDVYVPPGYDESQSRYPVVYIHYGAMAKDWAKMPNTLDNLIGKTIQPVIAVFIHVNQRAGFREYAGEPRFKFAQAVMEELVPFIDSKYRTIADPGARLMMGGSSGGYLAILAALKHPGVISYIAGHSTNVDNPRGDELRDLIASTDKVPTQFYVHWGKYDIRDSSTDLDRQAVNAALFQNLKNKGYVVHGGEFSDGYGYTSWRIRQDDILETFFPIQKTEK
jgi:enterochelin esterase-like enzyme/outer membrane protein assembly factor BamB